MFLSEDEIVQDIKDLDSVDLTKEQWEDHFVQTELCRWIRNSYDLWHKDNPHTAWGKDIIDGVDHTSNHPDMVSYSIFLKIKGCVVT